MYFLASILTVKLLVYWLFSNAKLHSTELQSPINCTALPRTNYLTHQITASNQYTASTVGRSAKASTNSEFSIGQKLPVEHSTPPEARLSQAGSPAGSPAGYKAGFKQALKQAPKHQRAQ